MAQDPPHRSPPTPVPLSEDEREALARRLAALPELSEVPSPQLEWLVGRGQFFRMQHGFRVHAMDDWVGLVLLISGRFSVRVSQNGTEREVREITPGRVTGYLPFSRMTSPRGYLVADGDVEVLVVRRRDFPAMVSACYEFTEICVQEMLARVRVFKAEDKHQEKMAALGRLAAGLAHELNNPASAVLRCARELDQSRRRIVEAASGLGSFGLHPESPVCRGLEAARLREGGPSTPVARAMREEALAEWLASRGLDETLADVMSEAGIDVADLDAASANLEPGAVSAIVGYVAADADARVLAADILSAATRIHSLVSAVKQHTHMDRAPVMEPLRVQEHVADAVTLLGSKASNRGITLALQVEGEPPPVKGTIAELNQAWVHLIDNAIDAAGEDGGISIAVRTAEGAVVVSVVDDGPGIPEELRERVFEPFFTTKDVGQGRGLGLDIVRTVVHAHRGHVQLDSVPGRTEFRVTLPVA